MALYLIAFNAEWAPDLTLEELRERGTAGKALIEEMTAAGVFVFGDGGLDASTVVCSVDPSSGSPLFTNGPFVESNEHLGGFTVIDVSRRWRGTVLGRPDRGCGRLATGGTPLPACIALSGETQSESLS